MNLPSSVKIGAINYRIQEKEVVDNDVNRSFEKDK